VHFLYSSLLKTTCKNLKIKLSKINDSKHTYKKDQIPYTSQCRHNVYTYNMHLTSITDERRPRVVGGGRSEIAAGLYLARQSLQNKARHNGIIGACGM